VAGPEISANLVMQLRAASGLPMMKCKEALEATGGDFDKAVEWLRKKGLEMAAKKADRAMKEGRISIKTGADAKTAAMVEVDCETEPVKQSPDFQGLSESLATLLLKDAGSRGPGKPIEMSSADILAKPHGKPGETVDTTLKTLIARIGENMAVRRGAALATTGRVATYLHFDAKTGVLVEILGEAKALSSSACEKFVSDLRLHMAANKPVALVKEDVPKDVVEKELEIYREQAKQDPKMASKPPTVVEKIVLGRLDKFFAERCLLSQPWVHDDKQTVTQVLEAASKAAGGPLSIGRFALFQVGA
jgi:elongation factor Ts